MIAVCCARCSWWSGVLTDLLQLVRAALSSTQIAGSRDPVSSRQLALYVERGVKPRRIDAATRVSLAFLSRLFEWPTALVVVRPGRCFDGTARALGCSGVEIATGRPRIPVELRKLIQRMAKENPLWGQERIANELWLKLGLQVSPRTVAEISSQSTRRSPRRGDQRWSTFLKNHAQAVVACGFFVAVTRYIPAALRIHCHRASEPTVDSLQRDGPSGASWTRQQLRKR